MSCNVLSVLLILAFLESGKSNSDVSIGHRWDGDGWNITCTFTGNENMSQINWELQQGPNRTKLGTYHPSYGIHIQKEYQAEVEIKGRRFPAQSSSFLHIKRAESASVQVCCAFITFPSGKLEQCTDFREEEASANKLVEEGDLQKLGFFGHLGVIIIGTLCSLFILTLLFHFCRKYNCRRRKKFEIRAFPTHSPAERLAEISVDSQSFQSSPNGFDLSKLYAKITEDLFYGRLWKSYQGQPKVWTQGTLTDQDPVYQRLEQSYPTQRSALIPDSSSAL